MVVLLWGEGAKKTPKRRRLRGRSGNANLSLTPPEEAKKKRAADLHGSRVRGKGGEVKGEG